MWPVGCAFVGVRPAATTRNAALPVNGPTAPPPFGGPDVPVAGENRHGTPYVRRPRAQHLVAVHARRPATART